MTSEQLTAKISGLSVVFWLALVLAGLSGCQSYQPEGGDLLQAYEAGRRNNP